MGGVLMEAGARLSPEGFRTAAYLEARARMDFVRIGGGKTNKNVKCKPPNTKCGGRCIPPAWDCRLKGEGSDPHLSAKKFDPVSGIANLERGVKRLGRFTTTGSFSELESAKRSLIRGSVKLKPGNLKEKEEFKTWLENNYLKVAVPAALASAGIAAHVLFKKGNTFGYRYGAGRKVDEAVTNGINAVLDRVPGVGASRSYTRKRGEDVFSSINASAQLRAQRGGQALTSNLGRGTEAKILSTEIPRSWASGNHALNVELNRVSRRAKGTEGRAGLSFYNWNTEHRVAFWGAKVKGQSIYAEPAAQSFLKNEFRLQANPLDSDITFKNELALMFERQQGELVDFAKLNNYRIQRIGGRETVHFDDRVAFIERYTRNINNEAVRNVARMHVESLLTKSPATRAKNVYNETVGDYDQYFSSVSRLVTEIGGAPDFDAEMRRRGLPAVRAIADRRRINYLMNLSTKPRRDSAGPAHDNLFLLDYYHTKVVGSARSTYSAPNNTILNAAKELEGRDFDSLTEAVGVLQNSHGFRGLQVESRNPFQRESMNAPRRRAPRRGKRLSREELIATYERAGLSREAAERAADKAISERGDASDSPNPRVNTYLETRARLDKRCGKSGIPDTKKCSKPTPAQSAEARNRERGRRIPGVTCNPPNKQCGELCIPPTAVCHVRRGGSSGAGGVGSALAKTALAAGVAAGGIAAFKNRRIIGKGISTTRQVIRAERNAFKAIRNKKLAQKNSYGRAKYSQAQATAAARREYIDTRRGQLRAVTPVISEKVIQRLSQKDVSEGISKLPVKFQQPAKKLVGRAKEFAAGMGLKAEGFEVVNVDTTHNFSTFRHADGTVASVGSVNDSVIIYNSQFKGKVKGVDKYGMAFTVDRRFDQKTVTPDEGVAIKKATKAMFDDNIANLPKNAFIFNKPYKDDGRGRAREVAYQRQGFRRLPRNRSDEMWAIKDDGKFRKLSDDELEALMRILQGRNDSAEKRLESKY